MGKSVPCGFTAGPLALWLMRALGRLLQLAGLSIPPLAIVAQLFESISVGQMLTFLVASAAAFWLGHILEGLAKR